MSEGERRCAVCEIDVYPTHAIQADMTTREQCPKCGAPFPRADMTAAHPSLALVTPTPPVRIVTSAGQGPDILTRARSRLSEIDRQLSTHDALIDERAQLARMIRAAERPAGRPRKRALRIAR